METMSRCIIFLLVFVFSAAGFAADPEAICVPWKNDQNLYHSTYDGAQVTLKGISRGTATEYKWVFGDGNETGWMAIGNPYNLEADHIYSGGIGTKFNATLWVRNGAQTDSDTYKIRILESTDLTIPSHLKVRVDMAIDEGLWYLHKNIVRSTFAAGAPGYGQKYGYWNDPGGYPLGATGTALNAFCNNEVTPNDIYDDDPYVETVRLALNYLLYHTYSYGIGVEPAGNPDLGPIGNPNGIGLVTNRGSSSTDGRQTYLGGICMVALASTDAPNYAAPVGRNYVYGRTLKEILQDMVDFFAWGQCDSSWPRGGWRYYANYDNADMSTTQWPALGIFAAEKYMPEYIQVPDFVRSELEIYLNNCQNMQKNADNGAFAYHVPWVSTMYNTTKQGAGLICHHFLGTPVDDPRIEAAIGYIYRHWNDTGTGWDDSRLLGNSYAMYAVMKGMIIPDLNFVTQYDYNNETQTGNKFHWFNTLPGQAYQGIANYIVSTQQNDGSWDDISSPNPVYDAFCTGWRVSILSEKVLYQEPVAVIDNCEDQHWQQNQDIPLDGSKSYHLDDKRKIVFYEWDFDCAPDLELNPESFQTDAVGENVIIAGGFPNEQIYYVALRVTDDNPDGPKDDIQVCAVSIHPPPHCPTSVPHPQKGDYHGWVGVPVQFDGSQSYDPDNEIVLYEWDFDNDGLFGAEDDDCFGQPSDGLGMVTQFTWNTTYTGTISLRVTDAEGEFSSCSDVDSCQVYIENHAPVCVFCREEYQTYPNQPVTLDASCSYDDDPMDTISFEWDIDDDGDFDDGNNPTAEFVSELEGEHFAKVRVTDNHGDSCTSLVRIIIAECANNLELDTGTGPDPIYIQPHDSVLIDMNALCLMQPVYGCQAVMNFDSTYFVSEPSGAGSPVVVAGGYPWDELIYNIWTVEGDMDVAVGIHLDELYEGTQEDGTVAKIELTSNGTEGITQMIFRPDVSDVEETIFADIFANPVYPNKRDSQDIVIDGTPPVVDVRSFLQEQCIPGGSPFELIWVAVDENDCFPQDAVTLEYYDGNQWVLIAENERNDGSYLWDVPEINLCGAVLRVSVSDCAGNIGEGFSVADFCIDSLAPEVVNITATQDGGADLTPAPFKPNAVQGTVLIEVTTSDNLCGVAAPPVVEVQDADASPFTVTYVGPNGPDAYQYSIEVTPTTANGIAAINVIGLMDTAGNIADPKVDTFSINKNQISGLIELEELHPMAAGLDKEVVFIATGSNTESWTMTIHFPARILPPLVPQVPYVLTDVPDGVTGLSAKTCSHLRRKLTGLTLDGNGQVVNANFTGTHFLKGGDFNNSNTVNILDFALLKGCYLKEVATNSICDCIDADGNGVVNFADFVIFRKNYFKYGDSQ